MFKKFPLSNFDYTKVDIARQKVVDESPDIDSFADNPMSVFGALAYMDASLVAGFRPPIASKDYLTFAVTMLEDFEAFTDDIRLVAAHTREQGQPIAPFYKRLLSEMETLTYQISRVLQAVWLKFREKDQLTYDQMFDTRRQIRRLVETFYAGMTKSFPILADAEQKVLQTIRDTESEFWIKTRAIVNTFHFYLNNLIRRNKLSELYPEYVGKVGPAGTIVEWVRIPDETRGIARLSESFDFW